MLNFICVLSLEDISPLFGSDNYDLSRNAPHSKLLRKIPEKNIRK